MYSTVFYGQQNPQNLKFELDRLGNKIYLYYNEDVLLGVWSIYTILGKFISKLEKLLVVLADSRISDISEKEEFWFNEAYLLGNPSHESFLNAFENAQIAIDIRMHIKSTGAVRNHGTAFRVKENNISNLYGDRKKIVTN